MLARPVTPPPPPPPDYQSPAAVPFSVPMGLPVSTHAPPAPPTESVQQREERELAEALELSARMSEQNAVLRSSDTSAASASAPLTCATTVDTSGTFPAALFGGGGGYGELADRQLAECSICFEDLCSNPCAVLCCAEGRRVCGHLLHHGCANHLPSKTCPLCRTEFSFTRVLPDLDQEPEAWFSASDVKGDGRLSKQETINLLLSQYPLDVAKFEEEMERRWPQFDPDGDGYVTRIEFFAPGTGLLAFVRAHRSGQGPNQGGGSGAPAGGELVAVPDVSTDRNAWFDYFDADKTGELNPEELTRALIKTYALGSDLQQVQATRELVAAVWPLFTSGRSISRQAFLQPGDGLADTLIAQLDLSKRDSPPQAVRVTAVASYPQI